MSCPGSCLGRSCLGWRGRAWADGVGITCLCPVCGQGEGVGYRNQVTYPRLLPITTSPFPIWSDLAKGRERKGEYSDQVTPPPGLRWLKDGGGGRFCLEIFSVRLSGFVQIFWKDCMKKSWRESSVAITESAIDCFEHQHVNVFRKMNRHLQSEKRRISYRHCVHLPYCKIIFSFISEFTTTWYPVVFNFIPKPNRTEKLKHACGLV